MKPTLIMAPQGLRLTGCTRVIGHGATRNTIGFRELTRHVSGYGTFWFV